MLAHLNPDNDDYVTLAGTTRPPFPATLVPPAVVPGRPSEQLLHLVPIGPAELRHQVSAESGDGAGRLQNLIESRPAGVLDAVEQSLLRHVGTGGLEVLAEHPVVGVVCPEIDRIGLEIGLVDVVRSSHADAGTVKGAAVERYFRDARVTELYEGTTEVQKRVIARQLLQEYQDAKPEGEG